MMSRHCKEGEVLLSILKQNIGVSLEFLFLRDFRCPDDVETL